jgi:type II secretory pathway component PulJ
MMDNDFILRAATTALGSSPVAVVLWVLLNRQQADNKALVLERGAQNREFIETVTQQMGARIARLEEVSTECNEDRKRLHDKLYTLLKDGQLRAPVNN